MMPRSLQGRLLTGVLAVVSAVWLIATAWVWFDARHQLDELLDGHLAQAAALLVLQQTQEIDDDHGVDALALHRYAPKVAFQVFHEGALALRSANAPRAPMVATSDRFEDGFKTVQIGGRDWRVFAAHGAERDVQVYVGEQTASRAAILWAVARGMLWPLALALPLMALAAAWVVRYAVAPLRRLGSSLATRPAHDLNPVRVEGAPSEMEPMVDALNGLFERIGALLDGERRFTADAAHELRTPIAAIRAQAQVALAEPVEAPRRHALRSTVEGCDRASHLVEQLLTLSRLEADQAPSLHVVDLATVARQVVADLAPRAVNKQQSLELDAAAPCAVAGDEVLLRVLVRNLVDNAVRYSGSSALVRVRVSAMAKQVVLQVEDSGPGLTHGDAQRLGDRFFRVSGSVESGSGLGWSIARRIAAVHHAALRAQRSAALGGLQVELSIASAERQGRI